MKLRRLLQWIPIALLAASAWTGCKGDGKKGKAGGDLVQRCEQLAKACGDTDKHVQKIVAECKQSAEKQVAKGCADEAVAAYACYEEKLCGKSDKVWALDDLGVLSKRHLLCTAERNALRKCVEGKAAAKE